MATLERLDLKLALIPLLSHRIEIDQLVLVKPDIMLETNAQGRPNWQFTPQTSPSAPQPGAAGSAEECVGASAWPMCGSRMAPSRGGTMSPAATQCSGSPARGRRARRRTADLHVTASATYNGAPFTLAGDFGPLTRLQEAGASGAWPVQLQMEAAGAKLALDGTIAQPQEVQRLRDQDGGERAGSGRAVAVPAGANTAAAARCQPGGAGRRQWRGGAADLRADAACRCRPI